MDQMPSGTYPAVGFKPQMRDQEHLRNGHTNEAYYRDPPSTMMEPGQRSSHLSESSTDLDNDGLPTIPADPVTGVVRAYTLPHTHGEQAANQTLPGILKTSTSLPRKQAVNFNNVNNNDRKEYSKMIVNDSVTSGEFTGRQYNLQVTGNTNTSVSDKSLKKVSFNDSVLYQPRSSQPEQNEQPDVVSVNDRLHERIGGDDEEVISPGGVSYLSNHESNHVRPNGSTIHVDEFELRNRGLMRETTPLDGEVTGPVASPSRSLQAALCVAASLVALALIGLAVLATMYGLEFSDSSQTLSDITAKANELGLAPALGPGLLFIDTHPDTPLQTDKNSPAVTYALSSYAYFTWHRPSHDVHWLWQSGASLQVLSLNDEGLLITRYLGDALSDGDSLFHVALSNSSWHAARVMNSISYTLIYTLTPPGAVWQAGPDNEFLSRFPSLREVIDQYNASSVAYGIDPQ